MQFEAKVIWHQAHEQDGKVVLWQTKLYGTHEGHGVALEVATAEETFDRTGTYLVTINDISGRDEELRYPTGVSLSDQYVAAGEVVDSYEAGDVMLLERLDALTAENERLRKALFQDGKKP